MIAALVCLRPSPSNVAIDAGIGLPGLGRLEMPMTATFSSDG